MTDRYMDREAGIVLRTLADIWGMIVLLWAVRPISARTARRRIRRAAADPAVWDLLARAVRDGMGTGAAVGQAVRDSMEQTGKDDLS